MNPEIFNVKIRNLQSLALIWNQKNWVFPQTKKFLIWVRFPYVHLTVQIFILNNLFGFFIFSWFLTIFFSFFLPILMVIISLELTRVNPDRNIFSINVELTSTLNIFSINVELTSTFLLYRGLVHRHHRILKVLIPVSLQFSGVNFWYFKLRFFAPTEFIVFNI